MRRETDRACKRRSLIICYGCALCAVILLLPMRDTRAACHNQVPPDCKEWRADPAPTFVCMADCHSWPLPVCYYPPSPTITVYQQIANPYGSEAWDYIHWAFFFNVCPLYLDSDQSRLHQWQALPSNGCVPEEVLPLPDWGPDWGGFWTETWEGDKPDLTRPGSYTMKFTASNGEPPSNCVPMVPAPGGWAKDADVHLEVTIEVKCGLEDCSACEDSDLVTIKVPLPEAYQCPSDRCGDTLEAWVNRQFSTFWACKPEDCVVEFGGVGEVDVPVGVCNNFVNVPDEGPPLTEDDYCEFLTLWEASKGCLEWHGESYSNHDCTVIHEDTHVIQWRHYIDEQVPSFQNEVHAMCMFIDYEASCDLLRDAKEWDIFWAMHLARNRASDELHADPRREAEAEEAASGCNQAIADMIIAEFGPCVPP